MFDLIGAITLTAVAVATPGLLILGSGLEARGKQAAAAVAGAWLVLVVAVAAAGGFTPRGLGPAGIGLAVLVPLLVTSAGLLRGSVAARALAATPLALLVALHAPRLLGVDFLILRDLGRLPHTFASSAGYGDILVGLAAVPVALMIRRQAPGWRSATLLWNLAGTADLLTAVVLGTGSAPGSPLRFIHEQPPNELMGQLPWLLIPGYLVPLFLMLHLFVFVHLARSRQPTRITDVRAGARPGATGS